MSRFYLPQTVYDAALDRIRWLFDEFECVIVNISGGKDSTVVLNLSLQVAEEKGRLPLPVMFIDQEAEWETVIDHIRDVFSDPRIKPYWLQMPIRLFNATSTTSPWLFCWDEANKDNWIREKEPNSIHVNNYGTDRFAQIYTAFAHYEFPEFYGKTCQIAGVRCEESPGRMNGLTTYPTYKWATWGSKHEGTTTFYPIYDWTYSDVWKAIHDNGWDYCKIYDYMYQYGIPVMDMRVSNVHHETAVRNLFYLQEIEPETWDKITARLSGINTAGQLKRDFFAPKEVPFMFKDWWEYRDYLLENLVTDPHHRDLMRTMFKNDDDNYLPGAQPDLVKTQIQMILINDWEGVKMTSFHGSHGMFSKRNGVRRRQDLLKKKEATE